MGSPEKKYNIVHVAGTNGKGSTCAFIEAGLRLNCGIRTGLFTSPHMHTARERMRVNGDLISEADFVELVAKWRGLFEQHGTLSVFEKLTLLALAHFADSCAEIVVLEVGVGGRLDSTNAIESPAVCAITHISLDHMNILGSTPAAIAAEKAGIIKPSVPTFTCSNQLPEVLDVIQRKADLEHAPLAVCPPVSPISHHFLASPHQHHNAGVALKVLENLAERSLVCPVPPAALLATFETVTWPGRMETLRAGEDNLILVDCAHNEGGASALVSALSSHPYRDTPVVFVFGSSGDKDYRASLRLLLPRALGFVLVRNSNARSAAPSSLAAVLREEAGPFDQLVHLGTIPFPSSFSPNVDRAPRLEENSRSRKVFLVEAEDVASALLHHQAVRERMDSQLCDEALARSALFVCTGSVFTAADARVAWVTLFPDSNSLSRERDWAHLGFGEDRVFVPPPRASPAD